MPASDDEWDTMFMPETDVAGSGSALDGSDHNGDAQLLVSPQSLVKQTPVGICGGSCFTCLC